MKNLLHQYLLKEKTVALQQEASDWQQAVKLCTNLMEEAGCVTPDYYKAILRAYKKMGPYFVLAPGIAIPHASPENGVIQDCFALVSLKHPVPFGDPNNDPVDILLAIATKDRKNHNENALIQVTHLLDNEDRVNCLRKISTLTDLEDFFSKISQKR